MATAADLTQTIPGYRLVERVYSGSRTVVYRGVQEAQAGEEPRVVIKLLQQDYPTFNDLLQFRNQYTIAKNLDSPGIVRPLCLEPYRNSYALVMEDFGGVSLREYAGDRELSVVEVLAIALQLTDILHYLHASRVIHKDIKPANILIHPETKQIQLIDFSISSLLPKETQVFKNPNKLEGTLAYLAPEQTGRMNRGIDYRADFYALGVTLFELLTGQLPFPSDDPMELVHCHLAKLPPSIHSLNSEIPAVLSEMIGKLMAKNAYDRYQSALGLKYDLLSCREQFEETGTIQAFEIATRDVSDRFLIPEKLYGREPEVQTLLEAFDRVADGASELMLVSGFSGIGKTAVVNEVHKPIVRQRGYFIKGKFDQFNRNIPFSAFVQAFRDLIGQLLGESDAQLQQWRANILMALGENAQVIIEVIPELEQIIGKQPPVPELAGTAAQNRFNLLLQNFIQLLTTKEHPLVIFLDDLQWADLASLSLIQLLTSQSDRGYLLIVGAYRDNEVYPFHPLMATLGEIRQTNTKINQITLNPLEQSDLNDLIADTICCSTEKAIPLTELVAQKTKCNPFFATQFLKSLYEDGLITFDLSINHWQCDLAKIRALAASDDVVEFMASQLQKLPENTQTVLQLAACIGNSFDLNTLSIIYQKSSVETANDLWKALQSGLILPQSELYKFFQPSLGERAIATEATTKEQLSYRFLHDRVQQAAYSLIPESQKKSTHLKIGKLLLQNIPEAEREDKIFDILNQLNYAKELIADTSEKYQLAELNLTAGRGAKTSTAYDAAFKYFTFGQELLAADSWQTHYELTLELAVASAEAAYLNTKFEQLENLVERVIENANNLLDKIKVYEVQIAASTAQIKFQQAVEMGLEVLQLLGVNFPASPTPQDIQYRLEETAALFTGKQIAQFLDLPEMTDLEKQAALRILSSLVSPAYITAPAFLPLIIAEMVHLSVKFGNAPLSAFAYGLYGLLLSGIIQDIETGYEFGNLALNIVERFQANYLKTKIFYTVGAHILHGKHHLKYPLSLLKEGFARGRETGDLETGYSAKEISQYFYFMGKDLLELEPEIDNYSKALAHLRQENALHYNQIIHQAILNLLGRAENPNELIGNAYNETKMIAVHQQANDRNGLHYFHFHKMIICYLFGEQQQARENAAIAELYLDAVTGMLNVPMFYFYDSLVQLAVDASSDRELEEYLNKVMVNQEKLQKFADSAPMNFRHKYDLITAEKYRVLEQKADAIEHYDRAIQGAKENGYIQEEALSNELAAKFYLGWGKEKVAAGYMQDAYYCYSRWGAKAKTDDLEKRYPDLLRPILQPLVQSLNPLETLASIASVRTGTKTSRSSTSSANTALDFAALLKASQAISGTIQLDELLHQLSQIILQNSGGDRCTLIVPNSDGEWQLRAIATPEQTELCSEPLDNTSHLPVKLIQYVKHTQEAVVIDDLKTDLPVIEEYLSQQQPKSILCLPLLDRGQLRGILYLENRSTSGVFTHSHILILNFLCTQAAISLENATLYNTLEQKVAFRTQELSQALDRLQSTQKKLVESEKMASLGSLVAGVAHEINTPLGTGVTAASLLVAKTQDFARAIAQGAIKRSTLSDYTAIALETSQLVLTNLQRASDLVLSFKQVAVDRSHLERRTFALKAYVEEILIALQPKLKQTPHTIAVSGDDSLTIATYPGAISQIVTNFVTNSIIHAYPQGNPGHIKINVFQPQKEQIVIQYQDDGCGIPAEHMDKIFEPFFTTARNRGGTGLGLNIVYNLITQKLAGQIDVQSDVGSGTTFTVAIPNVTTDLHSW